MSIYQTPLHFGYFLALLFAILLWIRAWQEERLSDNLLGFVLFFLAMEIQDYTFGFSGINVLWEELNGFPRSFNLAFAPTIYFYLKAQINRNFKFTKAQLIHYLPYFIYFMVSIIPFLLGKQALDGFNKFAKSIGLDWLVSISVWASYIYYFYQSLKIYKEYRLWAETQYSDTESISFIWIRNFIYLIIIGELFKFCWNMADWILGDLPYEQDWWWHLLTVGIICYVGIKGYSQKQPQKMEFIEKPKEILAEKQNNETELLVWKPKIERLFHEDKIYLEPELSLNDLANKLKTNTSVLSGAINQIFGKNFNDFVNEYRVNEFKKQIKLPENKHITLLGVAFDCGFNSKPTFNRAVKKVTGFSPKELV
jgi:AraC-like DNA-binding protein